MIRMDPRTGRMVDDEDDLPDTGMVGQQEYADENGDDLVPPDQIPASEDGLAALEDIQRGHANANQPDDMTFEPTPIYLPGEEPVGDLGFEPDPVYLPGQGPGDELALPDLGAPEQQGSPPVEEDQNGLTTPDLGEPSVAPDVGTPEGEPPPGALQLPEPNLPLPAGPGGKDVPMLVPPPLALTAPGGGGDSPDTETPVDLPEAAAAVPGAPAVPLTHQQQMALNQQAITRDAISERNKLGEIEKADAAVKANHANEVANIREQAKLDAQDIIERGQAELAANRQQYKEDFAKYRAMGEKDIWGDNPTRNAVLAGIALILGGRGGAGFLVGAVNGLEEKKKTEMALLAKNMEQDGAEAKDIREAMTEKMADWKNQQAAGLEAVAARTEAEMAAKGVPRAQIAANKEILAIRQKAQDAEVERDKLAAKAAEQKIKDDLAARKAEAEISLAEARTRHLGGGGKGKGGGGGAVGGGAGGDLAERAQRVADAIAAGAVDEDGNRRELHYGEKIKIARQNGIPLNGKSSETTLESINKTTAFDANQERKNKAAEQKYELAEQRGLTKVISDFASRDDYKKINSQYRQAKNIQKLLENPNLTGVEAAGLVQKLDSIHRGGVATEQSIHQYYERLGGTKDQIVGKLSQMQDGKLSAQQMHVIRDFAENLVNSSKSMLGDLHEDYVHATYGDPRFANDQRLRDVIEAQSKSMFGDIVNPKKSSKKGEGGTPETKAAPASSEAKVAKVIPIETAKDKALYIRAKSVKPGDPDYDDAQTWLRAHGK